MNRTIKHSIFRFMIMNSLKLYLLFLLVTSSCKSQKFDGDEKDYNFSICAYCGYGGTLSPEFNTVKTQFISKDTISLQNQFENGVDLIKLLSAISLVQFIEQNIFHPTEKLENELNLYRKSNDKIQILKGCTEQYITTVRNLFGQIKFSKDGTIESIIFD